MSSGVGLRTYTRLKRVEEQAHKLGFKFTQSKYPRDDDGIGLVPRDDELPDYARDAELWYGDVESTESFLRGVEWAKQYFRLLGLVDDAKIARKEQNVRNRKLVNAIKEGKVE